MKSNKSNKKCSACAKASKNTSLYGNYDAMADANQNSRLVQMIDATDPIECDK